MTPISSVSSPSRDDAIPSEIPTDNSALPTNESKTTKDDTTATGTVVSSKSDDTTITSVSKNSADDDAIMEEAEAEEDQPFTYDSFGLPTFVAHTEIKGRHTTAAVFLYFRELRRTYKHICDLDRKLLKDVVKESKPLPIKLRDECKTPPKSKVKSSCKSFFTTKVEKKTYNSVCLLCLKNIHALPNPPKHAWTHALCNVLGKSSNAEKHLHVRHSDEPEVITYFREKEEKKEADKSKAFDHPTALHGHFTKSRLSILREKMIDWMITCGIPHEVTQSEEFIAMFKVFDSKAKPVSRETFIEGMEKRFNRVILCVDFIILSFLIVKCHLSKSISSC